MGEGVIPRGDVDLPMPKVVPLTPGRIIQGAPDPEIIDLLERFLNQAKRGEVDGIAIAVSRPNNATATGFWYGESGHRLTAAVSMLNHSVNVYATELETSVEDDAG